MTVRAAALLLSSVTVPEMLPINRVGGVKSAVQSAAPNIINTSFMYPLKLPVAPPGVILYDAVAKQVDAIYSDSTLFKSSLAMWTKHMKKVSRFFGANLGGYVIVPVSGEIDKKTIDAADGFVAIFKNVPPKLKEMEKFLSGIPIDNIYVTDDIDNTDVNLKRMVDILDEVTTLSELNETIFDEPLPANYTVGIFLHEKATFVVKEVGEELDYMLI